MDQGKKAMYKAELQALKDVATGIGHLTSQLNNAVYPVVGPTVTIPALPTTGQIIQQQLKIMDSLATLIERLIDEV